MWLMGSKPRAGLGFIGLRGSGFGVRASCLFVCALLAPKRQALDTE